MCVRIYLCCRYESRLRQPGQCSCDFRWRIDLCCWWDSRSVRLQPGRDEASGDSLEHSAPYRVWEPALPVLSRSLLVECRIPLWRVTLEFSINSLIQMRDICPKIGRKPFLALWVSVSQQDFFFLPLFWVDVRVTECWLYFGTCGFSILQTKAVTVYSLLRHFSSQTMTDCGWLCLG